MEEKKQKAPKEIIAGDLVKLNRVLTVTNNYGEKIEYSWFDENQKLHSDVCYEKDVDLITSL